MIVFIQIGQSEGEIMVKRIKNYILVQRFDSEVKTNQYDSKKDALHSYRTTLKSAKDAFDEGRTQ